MSPGTNGNGAPGPGRAQGDEALRGLLGDLEQMPDGVRREAMRLTANALLSRAQMIEALTQSDRDLDTDCGYPKGPIATQLYQELYDREPIAARVVELFPHECWQVSPSVYESEEADVETEFEKAWDDLGQALRPEESWHSGESGSVVWEYLHRLDVISGIGQYGVMLLGLDDGLPLDQPASTSGQRKLLFARVFPEALARIAAVETDATSPRFGQPTAYDITFASPAGSASTYSVTGGLPFASPTGSGIGSNPAAAPGAGGFNSGITTALVHWTRVVHAADNRRENEVYGVPRMQQVLNRLLDLRKLYGGSAEMYWKGAFPGIALETWPQLGWDVDIDEEKTRDMMWRYQNSLQRYLQLTGQSAKPLSPQVVDPSGQIDKHIESICIKLGCPIRIFKGSERGELASMQDDAAWNDRIKQRCSCYVTPRLVVPFVDRLVGLKVLPQPEQYFVWWPDITSKSDDERATIASQRTTAIVAYSGAPNGPATIAPIDYWTRIQGFPDEEAQSIVDNAEAEKERIKKEQEAEAAKQAKAQADQAQQDHERQLALVTAKGPAQPPAPGSQADPTLPPGNVKGSRGTGGGGITPPRAAPAAQAGVGNWDPGQARDTVGRFASGAAGASVHRGDVLRSVGMAAGGLAYKGLKSAAGRATEFAKRVGAKVSHLEHVAKAMITDKVASGVRKLPRYVQAPVLASFKLGRAGTSAAFATWTAGQAMAERVARERGLSGEEARRLRGVLSSLDVVTFKPLSLGLHFAGMHAVALGLTGMIPPASAGYLAYSTARNPGATLRAARGVVRDTIKKMTAKKEKPVSGNQGEWPEVNNAGDEGGGQAHANASLVADALEAHDYDDWYIALLSSAVGETDDVARAIEVANAAYEEVPAMPGDEGGDVWAELGVTREQALASLNIPLSGPDEGDASE